ncbi:MAG TPA: TolC family protein [Chitinophagaceae bacterium]|nr:TolC family protein [Chitinophagaceae bacterium]
MLRPLRILLPALLAFPGPGHGLWAQGTTRDSLPANWTLAQCIAYADTNNIQITNLRLSTLSGEQDLLQARAAKNPNLSGSLTQDFAHSNAVNPLGGPLQSETNSSGNYSVNSQVTLYNGGYLNENIKAYGLLLTQSELNVAETRNSITLSITGDFLNILLSRENIVYLQDLVTTSQAQLKQGQQLFSSGSMAKKDFVQLQAQAATDQYSLISAQNSMRLNQVALKELLELPTGYDFQVAVPDTLIVEQAYPALPDAITLAESTRPEVKSGETGLALSQVFLEEERAQQRPSLSVGAGISSGYANTAPSKYFTQVGDNFYQQVGLTLSIPFYSRRIYKTAIAKDQIAIQQAQLSLTGTRITLDAEVEQAFVNLQNAQAQYISAQTAFLASDTAYSITNEQFKLGSVNLVELLQQKNLYTQALQQYIQAKYTAILYDKIYKFYTGQPITL